VQIALATGLDLLDFDVPAAEAIREVREVTTAAGMRLDKVLFRLPEIYRNACQVAQTLAVDGLGLAPGGLGNAPRVRVAVGRLERGYRRSLRLSHSVGFDEDPDESMLIPLDGSVAGAAWRDRDSRVEAYPLSGELDLPGPAHRRRRKSRPPNLAWVMCVPILDESGDPRLLVQLDGNFTLPKTAATTAALTSVEEAIKDFFNLVLHELKELEGDDGP
jgi:NTE family protein